MPQKFLQIRKGRRMGLFAAQKKRIRRKKVRTGKILGAKGKHPAGFQGRGYLSGGTAERIGAIGHNQYLPCRHDVLVYLSGDSAVNA
jgi:hypothetical protein